jgi:hypothetical protein
MKKVLLFAIVLGGAVAFTSCGKDECECTVGGTTTVYTEDDLESGDGSMEDACNAADAIYKAFNASDGCKIK